MKTYILQKDLPDVKAGAELIQDEEDICTYDYTAINGEACWYRKSYVENNPEWFKEKKEEKPTLRHNVWTENFIQFHFRNDKVIAISRERLAEILIAESHNQCQIGIGWMERMFTESELLEAEENAWDAARDIEKFLTDVKYQTFSDYKNSIKQ